MLRAMIIVLIVAIPVYAEPPVWPECMPYMHPTTCDDDIICTHDSCDSNGYCVFEPNHDGCDDEVVCNGPEYCDVTGGTGGNGCYHSYVDPCNEGDYCMETGEGWCSECVVDFNWDGNIDEDDYDIFDACWGVEVDCVADGNGDIRMPADAGNECCSVNACNFWDEGVIDHMDFGRLVNEECEGVGWGSCMATYAECVYAPPQSSPDFYCDDVTYDYPDGEPKPYYCTDPNFPFSGYENRCHECTDDSHCGSTEFCQLDSEGRTLGWCLECYDDGDCDSPDICHDEQTSGQTPYQTDYPLPTFDCVECFEDSDCSGGDVCHNYNISGEATYTCVECADVWDCGQSQCCDGFECIFCVSK